MNITRVGADIAKSVFHVHGVDRHEKTQWQVRLRRHEWLDMLCQLASIIFGKHCPNGLKMRRMV